MPTFVPIIHKSDQAQVELVLDGEIENDSSEYAMFGDSFLDDTTFVGLQKEGDGEAKLGLEMKKAEKDGEKVDNKIDSYKGKNSEGIIKDKLK